MSRLEDVAYKPPTASGVATAASNTASVVTITAPGVGRRIYVVGYTVSYSGTVAAAVVPDIVSGAVVVDRFQVPAALLAPIVVGFARPMECPDNTSVVATAPAGGVGIVGTMVVRYFIA
jgi:hypothetical protein